MRACDLHIVCRFNGFTNSYEYLRKGRSPEFDIWEYDPELSTIFTRRQAIKTARNYVDARDAYFPYHIGKYAREAVKV